jgi:dipeptide/tripeptide permease
VNDVLPAVYELFERMAYYGIASNLIIYLTDKLHQGTVEASNNVTNWSGTVFLTPLLGAHVADAYLGRYWTFVLGSAIYFLVSTPRMSLLPSLATSKLILSHQLVPVDLGCVTKTLCSSIEQIGHTMCSN